MAEHDELIDDARSQTGLDDFGDDSFREGLERLVRSLQHEAKLNAMGQEALRGRIVALLAQRLQIEDWFRRHPEMGEEPIESPLIGLGLPRTGSTALSFLLAEDPETRSLRLWESGAPAPPPSTVVGPDPRIATAEMQVEQQRMFSPRSAGARAVDRDRPDGVPGADGARLQVADLPRVRVPPVVLELAPLRRRPHLDVPVRAARVAAAAVGHAGATVAAQVPDAPVVPRRTSTASFPDARFVMTDRDPADVIVSVADVYLEIGGMFSEDIDLHYLGALNLEHWSVGHGTRARVPRRGQRPPVLRHRLPHHADRPDR